MARAENTKRETKKEHTLHMRDAVKALRADNKYLQVAREAEEAQDDTRRTNKYNQVMPPPLQVVCRFPCQECPSLSSQKGRS